MNKLNPQQADAVRYIEGPLLVLAGAGSGKTRVITEKIIHLITRVGLHPAHILAVTFTNKAAAEMRTRICSALPVAHRRGLKIATFHTLGLTILKRHAESIGLKRQFSILDQEDTLTFLRELLPKHYASDREAVFNLQQQISAWKNAGLMPGDLSHHPQHTTDNSLISYYHDYQNTLTRYNAVDFDDLITLPVRLLQKDPMLLTQWQNKIRYILVDEYQDSNESQYNLIKLLAGPQARLTAVGDDDQSIYAWRGAKPENLALLASDYSQLKIIKLEQNYRSSTRILSAANQLIAHNTHLFEKSLWSDLGAGEIPRVITCHNETHEAEQIVSDLIAHRLRNGTPFHHYAILYRSNHQSKLFEKILREHSVAYRLSGGQSWFAKKEIKDFMAYLKLLANPQDDAAFLRAIQIPKRGIGDAALAALKNYAHHTGISLFEASDHLAIASRLTPQAQSIFSSFKRWLHSFNITLQQQPEQRDQQLKRLLAESGYIAYLHETSESPLKAQKRQQYIDELILWINNMIIKNPANTLSDVLNKMMLIDLLDQKEDHMSDAIQLSTLHAAKGLEFPFVYLAGLEEGLLPHHMSTSPEQIEEERRLFYVGITRAQQGLSITLARKRRTGGEQRPVKPSRFLGELPHAELSWQGIGTERDPLAARITAQTHIHALKKMLQERVHK